VTEEKLRTLLQKTDQTAGHPASVSVELSTVRRRAHRRRTVSIAAPIAAAAAILIAAGISYLTVRTAETSRQREQIASLEIRLQQLQARADAAFRLVTEIVEHDRQQTRLAKLEAKLASIGDPHQRIQEEIENTAFILVYHADRLRNELNQTHLAIDNYYHVIERYPRTRSARTARQRLSEIGIYPANRNGSKI
jgi:hypothetical protein